MDPTRNRADYWAAQRRQARLDRDIFPIDHRIKRLRADIRKRLHHLRALKEKGYPLDHSRRLLVLLCRTLAADRAYRKAMVRTIMGDTSRQR
ncbi:MULTISPECIES: hypothetical protein [Cupriavidus]|uniref:Uncharacterized protein n=1 Tax=Cupriavidus pauculus TaxID=82633 RepID=A0A3G8H784_9BURK|nr:MULTISPECIES: hypothetical protein [Cupriavidus]AZG16306.1 hypothetical protein EHF44_23210 [Cupriavidus pauculus]MDT6963344.1 hypothetical protein [Cupriavidus sp. SZY C1]